MQVGSKNKSRVKRSATANAKNSRMKNVLNGREELEERYEKRKVERLKKTAGDKELLQGSKEDWKLSKVSMKRAESRRKMHYRK